MAAVGAGRGEPSGAAHTHSDTHTHTYKNLKLLRATERRERGDGGMAKKDMKGFNEQDV